MALNKVMLIGNVGQDPEIRYFDNANQGGQGAQNQNNNKVANFSIATTERYRDRQGNTQENTEWHNIVAWRWLADIVERFVHKGSQLYIEGALRTRSWVDKNQVTRYTTEIVASNIQLLGRREQQNGNQGGYGNQNNQGGYSNQNNQGGYGNQTQGSGQYSSQQSSSQTPIQAPTHNSVQNQGTMNTQSDGQFDITQDDGVDDLPF